MFGSDFTPKLGDDEKIKKVPHRNLVLPAAETHFFI